MKKFAALALSALALAACQDSPTEPPLQSTLNPRGASLAKVGAPGDAIPGQYIVVFKPDIGDVDKEAAKLVKAYGAKIKHVYKAALKGTAVEIPDAVADALRALPGVAYVEQNQLMRAIATQDGATWGLDRADQRDLPLSSTYEYNANGTGVTAYIIDTGIRSHTEFGARTVSGFTSINDGNGTDDCNGHGTHVAGTVGSTTYGIAKNVSLVAVRVLDCNGSGTTFGVIAGVDWVTSNHNGPNDEGADAPAVANMSLGGGASTALDDAVMNSINDGVTYAIAAGNSGLPACWYSPARVTQALTVGASDNTDRAADWSNYGSCLDLYAPGVSITSTWNNGATNTISGTSMAAPHTAGAAALYLEANPNAAPAAVAQALVSNATAGVLSNMAPGDPNKLLYMAFIIAGPPPPPPSPPADPTNLVATAIGSSQINLTWSDNSSDETGFNIERCQGAGCETFAEIASVGGSVTSFSNTGLMASASYSYRVRARNGTVFSGYSNTATAATSAPPPPPPSPAQVIINEILANEPGSNTAAEFVELVNVGGSPANIGGWTIRDNSSRRHTFAAGTTLEPGKAIVVFAGASARDASGLPNAVAASTGSLSLSNSSDQVRVRNSSGTTINSFNYNSSLASTDGVSMNRNPDATANGTFVLHTTVNPALNSSAGTQANGSSF